ncbi:MAG: RNA polymerase sigma factor RpoD/SigA, partial [Bacteroidota bacterium]
FLQEIGNIPLLKAEDEVALAKASLKGSKESADKLVESNLRFVVSVAKQYQNQGLPLSDLINIGIIGLVKAVRRYDHTRGFKLISYGVWWIRQSILQALAEEAKVVRIPLNRVGALNKIHKAMASLEQSNERQATIEEISEEIDMPESEIRRTLQVSNRHSSLNSPFVQGEDSTLLDVLEDKTDGAPDKKLMDESLRKEINNLIDGLKEREKKIISLYFGINTDHPMTLEEIGKKLTLTRERVRQIKEKSLVKLRNKSYYKNLEAYLGG